jgi:hypothetical protein
MYAIQQCEAGGALALPGLERHELQINPLSGAQDPRHFERVFFRYLTKAKGFVLARGKLDI